MVEADFPEEILLVLLPAALWTVACFFGGVADGFIVEIWQEIPVPADPEYHGYGPQKQRGKNCVLRVL